MKAKPTLDDIRTFLATGTSQPGRRPKKPKGVEARLEQLAKESDAWVRLCAEVWFPADEPLIEEAIGAGNISDVAERYDEAIACVRWVAGCAKVAEEKLKVGKEKAKGKQKGR